MSKVFFKDKRAELYVGDFSDVYKEFPSTSIDLIFTSFRYNVGKIYDICDDLTKAGKYLHEISELFFASNLLLKPGGHLGLVMPLWVTVVPNTMSNEYVVPYLAHIISSIQRDSLNGTVDLKYIGSIPWIKHMGAGLKNIPLGSIYNKPKIPLYWELISFWRKGTENRNDTSGESPNSDFVVDMTTPWFIKEESNIEHLQHPAPFPEELVSRVLKYFTREGEIILDPYCGSGTTIKVALDMNRYAIGCDISENYIKRTMSRCELNYTQVI